MDSLFKQIDKDTFLREYWQQKPFLFKNAYKIDAETDINGDDLAYLACLEHVESRLVMSDPSQSNWQVEAGPFAETRFAELPEDHWTLMVQSVDLWSEDLHALLQSFDFLPSWRKDDILATYATDGGGVGPHFDFYDVFLIQANGHRQWQLGQHCDQNTPLQDSVPLKLLKTFEHSQTFELAPGDILYVPPQLAHWGTAIGDDCITLSVGFRAPSEYDLVEELGDWIADQCRHDIRYSEANLQQATTNSGEINSDSLNSVNTMVEAALKRLMGSPALKRQVQHLFAKQVTEARTLDMLEPDEYEGLGEQLSSLAEQQQDLHISFDPVSRTAYINNHDGSAQLYINGQAYTVNVAFAEAVCAAQISAALLTETKHRQLLEAWLRAGYIYLD